MLVHVCTVYVMLYGHSVSGFDSRPSGPAQLCVRLCPEVLAQTSLWESTRSMERSEDFVL